MMISKIFLGMSLVGSEWVLYFLILLSVLSMTLILERMNFYRKASRGLSGFRRHIRTSITQGRPQEAAQIAQSRYSGQNSLTRDLETEMTLALTTSSSTSLPNLTEVAQDAVIRARLSWEKNLSTLATIGSNAPFIGLFGTVLGVIKAFHHLSFQSAGQTIGQGTGQIMSEGIGQAVGQQLGQQATSLGTQVITSGIAEALVATAVGLLVAIPAVVAFNLFQRRVKSATAEAEALKSFLIGSLSERK